MELFLAVSEQTGQITCYKIGQMICYKRYQHNAIERDCH